MARRKSLKVHVVERFVHDPEAVERGLQTWAAFLDESARRSGATASHPLQGGPASQQENHDEH